jgi:anti-anti-sigma factor
LRVCRCSYSVRVSICSELRRRRCCGSLLDSTAPEAAAAIGFVCLRDQLADGRIHLALAGELDVDTAPELDQALRAAQHSAQFVSVELRRLSFMDCRGLAIIVAAAKRGRDNDSTFRVVRGPPHIHRLFTLTDTDQRVQITPTHQR